MTAYYYENTETFAALGDVNTSTLVSSGRLRWNAGTQQAEVGDDTPQTTPSLYNSNAPTATVAINDAGYVVMTSIAGQDVIVNGGLHVEIQSNAGGHVWRVDGYNGSFYPTADNVADIGQSYARPRIVYASAHVDTPFVKLGVQALAGTTVGITSGAGAVVTLDASAGNQTANVESPANNPGSTLYITRIDATSNTCVLITSGGSILNGTTPGATTFALTSQYKGVTLATDGTNWHAVGIA